MAKISGCEEFVDSGYEADDLVRAYCGRCGIHILSHRGGPLDRPEPKPAPVVEKKPMHVYAGIDPGQSGGLALVGDTGGLIEAVKMPATDRDIYDTLSTWAACYRETHQLRAMLEFVRSSPQMGVASAFKFGVGYGGLRMALVASGIPFDEVVPHKWQRVLGCLSGGDKNVTKRRAQELFPSAKVTHATADAMLLAEYGKRVALGQVA